MVKDLKEYAANSTMEFYTGIVLDPEKNEFKVVSGKFHDKKDFYEKMVKRGLVLRKCFESRIWDWIEKNAPDDLTAYLMYSTAFSKWRGNNVLSDYYVKLLNDIPALNREEQKGNPNSKGKKGGFKNESVITEDNVAMPDKKYYTGPEIDKEWANTRKVRIYPVTFANERDPKYANKPIVSEISAFDTDNPKKKFDDPDFYRLIFKLLRIYKIGNYPYFDIVYEDDPRETYRVGSGDLLSAYYTKNKNPFYMWGPKDSSHANIAKQISHLQKSIQSAEEEGVTDDVEPLKQQLNRLIELYNSQSREFSKAVEYLDDEDKERLKELLSKRRELSKDYVDLGANFKSDTAKDINAITNEIKELKDKGMTQYKNSPEYKWTAKPEERRDAYAKLQNVAMGNPAFNGGAFDAYAAQMDKRNSLQKQIAKDLRRTGNDKFLDVDLTPKTRIDPSKSKLTKNDLNQAFSSEKEREFSKKAAENKIDSAIHSVENSFKSTHNLSKNDFRTLRDTLFNTKLRAEGKEGTNDERREMYWYYSSNADKYENDLNNMLSELSKEYTNDVDNVEGKFVQDNIKLANKYKDISPNILSDTIKIAKKDMKSDHSNFWFLNKVHNEPELYKDKLDRWFTIITDKLKNINQSNKQEAAVNDGVAVMYNTMPIGGQPMDTYQTRKGILPVGGTFVEADKHSELNQDLFNNDKLKPEVREALLDIAEKFKETLELPIEPVDIYFTGSSANYNYNDQSDIDLHLVYDFEQVGNVAEVYKDYLKMAKKVFNNNYNIKVKGLPVEVGAENLNEPLIATAVYSVQNDNWIRKPTNDDTEIAEPDTPYYKQITSEIEKAIESKDSNIIGDLWKQLGKLRKDSLEKEGEFGPGNSLFKKLRNLGYLNRLKDAYYNSVSAELSLEALEEIK